MDTARSLRFVFTLLTVLGPVVADEAKPQRDDSKLITRVYGAPRSLFFGVAPNGVDRAADMVVPKTLPATRSGGARFDVLECLSPLGVIASPGSKAIFFEKENALVVNGPPEMQDLVESLFHVIGCGDGLSHCEVSAMLLQFEDDPVANNPTSCRSLADLKAIAGDSLRGLDAVRIITKSGQRMIGISREANANADVANVPNPQRKDAKSQEMAPDLAGSRGSLLEVEPVIGPDGTTMDMSIRYEGRFSVGEGRPDAEFRLNTDLRIPSGQSVIASVSAVRGRESASIGKVKRWALLIGARVFSSDRRTAEERRFADEAFRRVRDERLIREAFEDLDAPR